MQVVRNAPPVSQVTQRKMLVLLKKRSQRGQKVKRKLLQRERGKEK